MKKFLPVVLVVIVIGVAAFFLMNKGSNVTDVNETSTESEEETFSGSLMDAVKLGVAMKCTYEVEGSEYVGYVKGNNYRGKMTTEGRTTEVIVKDNCMWSWSSDNAEGMKTCIEETEVESEEGTIWEQAGASNDVNYRCVPAAVTDAEFTPPTDIQFLDLDSMMEGLKDQMGY